LDATLAVGSVAHMFHLVFFVELDLQFDSFCCPSL